VLFRSFEIVTEIASDISDLHENPRVLATTSVRLRTSYEETIDKIARECLDGAPAYMCTKGSLVSGSIKEPVQRDFFDCETLLLSNDVPKVTTLIPPTGGIGTQAIRESYVGLAHTDLNTTLRQVDGFVDAKDYGLTGQLMEGEIGSIGGVRILLSSRGKINYDGTYTIFILGADAYHITRIPVTIFGMKMDPRSLDKYTEVSYSFMMGARITNPLNVIRMLCSRDA